MPAKTATFAAAVRPFAFTAADGLDLSFPVGKPVTVSPVTRTRVYRNTQTGEVREREVEIDVAALCREYVPTYLAEVSAAPVGPAAPQASATPALPASPTVPANPSGPGPIPNPLDIPPTDDDDDEKAGDGLDALSAADLVELAEIREVTSDGGPDSLSLDNLKERVEKAEIKADRRSTEKMLAALEAAGHDLNKDSLIDALRQVGAKASELIE